MERNEKHKSENAVMEMDNKIKIHGKTKMPKIRTDVPVPIHKIIHKLFLSISSINIYTRTGLYGLPIMTHLSKRKSHY